MFLGYIINSSNSLLRTISLQEIEGRSPFLPVLIVGTEQALEYKPNLELETKTINESDKVYWCPSKDESSSTEDYVTNFISNCFQSFKSSYKLVPVYKQEQIEDVTNNYIHTSKGFVSYSNTTSKTIWYLNKNIYSYFGNQLVDVKSSWDQTRVYCKAQNLPWESVEQLEKEFVKYGLDISYLGAFILQWQNKQPRDNVYLLWERAFRVEEFLSDCKIKIDVGTKIKNPIAQTILDSVIDGYIKQQNIGTNKTTGRIYTANNSFSIQTLAGVNKELVIAEEDSLLVEIDYQYFEFSLLLQILGITAFVQDPHEYMAEVLFNDKSKRSIAKTINYGFIYGESLDRILSDIKSQYGVVLTKKEFESKLDWFVKPLRQFEKKLSEEFETVGSLTNYYGRVIHPTKKWACLNNYIQSTASDLFIIKLEKLMNFMSFKYPLSRIVLQKHDSILLDIKSNDIVNGSVIEDVLSLLQSEENGLKAGVDYKFGTNWKELT